MIRSRCKACGDGVIITYDKRKQALVFNIEHIDCLNPCKTVIL